MQTKETEIEQQKFDGLEKLRAYRAANPDDEDNATKRWRAVRLMLLLLFICAIVIYGAKLGQTAWQHLRQQRLLNETTAQVSQLVDYMRKIYEQNKENNSKLNTKFIITQAIAEAMQFKEKSEHPFGGKIMIAPSHTVVDTDGLTADTFKISLQNLPHQACVDLAQIVWGTYEQGLRAVALGHIDERGQDKAFDDVDYQHEEAKIIQVQDDNGQWQSVALPPRNMLHVAQTNRQNSEALFSKREAVFGCDCGNQKSCSLALHYTF